MGSGAKIPTGLDAIELKAKDGLRTKFIECIGDAKIGSDAQIEGDINVGGLFKAGDELHAKNITVENGDPRSFNCSFVKIGSDAVIDGKIDASYIEAKDNLHTTGKLSGNTQVKVGSNAVVKGGIRTIHNCIEGLINESHIGVFAGDKLQTKYIDSEGNVKVGTNAKVDNHISGYTITAKDGLDTKCLKPTVAVNLGSVKNLEKIDFMAHFISGRPTLILNSNDINTSNNNGKIKVYAEDTTTPLVVTPSGKKDILEKFEFYKKDMCSPEKITRLDKQKITMMTEKEYKKYPSFDHFPR